MSIATVGYARERAGAVPMRAVAGRSEWKTLATLHDWRTEWSELSARALEPNVFYDPAFALAAAPVFGDPGAVLVWSRAGRLIGCFPAGVQRRYGVLSVLSGWTHPYAPYGVPLVDPDEAEAALTGFFDHVERSDTLPQLVILPMIRRDGPFGETMRRVLARRGGASAEYGTHARAMLAPEGEKRATYLDHIAQKKIKELRRQRRRLDEQGAVSFVTARGGTAIAPALADYLMLEATGWKGRGGTAARQSMDVLLFMQAAVAALSVEGRVRIDRLVQGAKPLAAGITLRAGDTAWFWKIAYDEAAAKSSPGVQLTLDLTKDLLADASLARADSCATAGHPMIDHMWAERLTLTDLLIAPSSAALNQFRFAQPLETLRRRLVATAKTVRDRVKPDPAAAAG